MTQHENHCICRCVQAVNCCTSHIRLNAFVMTLSQICCYFSFFVSLFLRQNQVKACGRATIRRWVVSAVAILITFHCLEFLNLCAIYLKSFFTWSTKTRCGCLFLVFINDDYSKQQQNLKMLNIVNIRIFWTVVRLTEINWCTYNFKLKHK